MIIAFIIWSACCVLIIGLAVWAWNGKKAVGFFAGVDVPKVKDIRKYNHAVSTIWILYAILFELLGIPFLFFRQNSPIFILPVLGVAWISILLPVAYTRVLAKYEQTDRPERK